MNHTEFQYWLRGYYELTPPNTTATTNVPNILSTKQAEVVLKHADLAIKQSGSPSNVTSWIAGTLVAYLSCEDLEFRTKISAQIDQKIAQQFEAVTQEETDKPPTRSRSRYQRWTGSGSSRRYC